MSEDYRPNESELQQIWRTALGEFELTITRAQFNTWFKGTYIADIKNKEVIIGTPTPYAITWLNTRFSDPIKKIVKKITKKDIKKVSFIVKPNKKKGQNIKQSKNNLNIQNRSSKNSKQKIYNKAQQSIIPEF